MAAAKLVTRCPACRTAFRLVADQLRLRQGLVRCGQCDTVFDAREHLIELPAPEAAPATGPAAQETSAQAALPAHAGPHHRAAHEKTFEDAHDGSHEGAHEDPHEAAHARAPRAPRKRAHAAAHPGPDAATAQPAPADSGYHAEHDVPPAPAFVPPFDPGYDVPALDAPTVMLYQTQAEADQAAQAAEAARHDQETGGIAEDDEPSAVFVPGVIEQEPDEAATQADGGTTVEPAAPLETAGDAAAHEATGAGPAWETDTAGTAQAAPTAPEAETTAAPAHAATPWPTLDPRTLSDDLPPFAPAAAPEADGVTHAAQADDAASTAPAAASPAPLPAPLPPPADSGDATHTAGIPPDTAPAPQDAPASHLEPADAAAVPSASGYLRAEAQADFPEIPAAIAREQAVRQWTSQNAPDAPVFAPDFLRHARERDPGPARRRRRLQKLAIGVLAVAALAQLAFLARSQLAGQFPLLRPAFEALCAPLRCEVAPWRDIDALRIESSQLQKQDEESDAYLLAVTMRNQSRATVALPAIELVMTDLQDQLLLRKVLQPADYLEPAQRAFATQGLRAGTELPVRVRFRTQQAAANYRVLIFYP
ncbi:MULTISPECIES: DUF3426 domain-containing protein [Cupriavidus]